MSAAVRLREAAKVLRERAKGTSETPWQPLIRGSWGASTAVATPLGHPIAFVGEKDTIPEVEKDCAYIAMMDPLLGIALADTLELEAALIEGLPKVADAWSLAIEHVSGIKGAITLSRDDQGEIRMHAESSSGLIRIADLILGDQS